MAVAASNRVLMLGDVLSILPMVADDLVRALRNLTLCEKLNVGKEYEGAEVKLMIERIGSNEIIR